LSLATSSAGGAATTGTRLSCPVAKQQERRMTNEIKTFIRKAEQDSDQTGLEVELNRVA
jgi:hypothetical protein